MQKLTGIVTDDFITNLTFCYRRAQHDEFIAGELGSQWAKKYPELFDEDDRRLYRNQCGMGYHFFEWLAAVLLYESTGYRSLVQKYGATNHSRKLALWEKIAPPGIRHLPCEYGWPDLFAYAPDHKDWFFCETKAKDKLSHAQRKCFQAIYAECGKKVYLLQFIELH